jgi:hypothetical protein
MRVGIELKEGDILRLSTKRLLFNRFVVIAIGAFCLLALLSWLFRSRYLNIAFMDMNAPDIRGHSEQARAFLMQGIFTFSNYMGSVFFATINFLPFLSALLCMNFLSEKEGFFHFAYFRVSRYKKFVRKRIFQTLLISAAVMFAVYLMIIVIGLLISNVKVNPQDGTGMITAFDDIVGNKKTPQLLVIRYLLDGVIKCILAPFCFGLLTIATSFLTDKKYIPLIAPLAYYILSTTFLDGLHLSLFSPELTINFTIFTSVKNFHIYTYDALLPMLPLICFSIVVIEYKLRRGERLGC